MRWLRQFFYSDDPTVKVAAALSEPEGEMVRELLANEGVPSTIKNMHFLSVTYGFSSGNDFDLWVRRSDVEQALDVLEAVLRPEQLTELEEAG